MPAGAPRPFLRLMALSFMVLGALAAAPPSRAGEFEVARRPTPDVKAVFGQVQSRDMASARTRIGGTVVSRAVDEGAHVKAGDVLAVVTDQKLALQAQSLDGQISALGSQLDNANVALNRAAELLPRGFTTRAAYDQAKTQVDVLSHQLDAMKSQRAVIAQQMREGEVLAPKDGVALTVSVVPGSVVLPGEAIARIAAGARFVRLGLPERHAGLLKLDAPVRLAPREEGEPAASAPDQPSPSGKIAKIYPEIENGRVIADAEIAGLDAFFIGERVRVYMLVGERDALLIPRDAVATRAGVDYVRLARPEGPLEVAVVFADSPEPGMVEILSGLQPGDKALTP